MSNQKILSPAMLKCFEECRKKYFLRYVRNIMMPQSSVTFEKGKNIHALANYYLSGIDYKGFEKALNTDETQLWERLKSNEFFKKDVFKTEFALNFRIEENWFGGRIDAVVKDNDNYYILDYKTGKAPKDIIFDYQTMVYAVAMDKFLENYSSLNFIYIELQTEENKVVNITKELLAEYISRLSQIATKINNLSENSLRKKENCKCEYEKICF